MVGAPVARRVQEGGLRSMRELRATSVRVGLRVMLIPEGQPIPDGAIVYGKAPADCVYRAFYEDTRCRNGHEKIETSAGAQCRYVLKGWGCGPHRPGALWPMGVPA